MKRLSATTSSELREWLQRRFKRKSSTQTTAEDAPDIVHHQLLKDIELDSTFFEHTLTMEQLNDLFPLSRICVEDPRRTRGLNKDEAMARLSKDGRNIVCAVTGKDALKIFLSQFLNTFRMLLLLVALTCLIIYIIDTEHLLELYLTIILIGVSTALCLISYWQEKNAYAQVRGFQSIVPTSCIVVRSGRRVRVNASEIVTGDVVYLSPGARVPADLRLIYTNGLFLETSWISGEIDPLQFYDASVKKGISAFAAQNIAFNGCQCVRGDGLGVVIKTANNTVIGRLMETMSQEEGRATRLELEHKRFVTFITVLAFILATLTFCIGIIMNHFHNFKDTFINGFLVIIVANLPQGLPITLAAALIIVARRLAKKGLYMKRLDVAETLGTATVVMCDKRGVFTSSDITVTDVWHDRMFFRGPITSGRRYSRSTVASLKNVDEHADALLTTMSVCNKAQIESVRSGSLAKRKQITLDMDLNNISSWGKIFDNGSAHPDLEQITIQRSVQLNSIQAAFQKKNITGNPSEVALLKYVEETVSVQSIRNNYEIVFEIPFDAGRRLHVVVARDNHHSHVSDEGNIKFYMFVKGAPEEVLLHCSRMSTTEGETPITEGLVNEFTEAYMKLGSKGRTCIAFAMTTFEAFYDIRLTVSSGKLPEHDLCFLGMAAMYDPPRSNVDQSIAKLRAAGVKCFMVTGDHPSTATAVAKYIGLLNGNEKDDVCEKKVDEGLSVIHGEVLDLLTPEQWDEILAQKSVVFARTTPAQKLIIVKECQKRKEVVAVTGDGVFDAPALKRADVGVALEAVGSIFAKEAADMVLIDNDVKNIVKGIEEGRLLYANLKKTIAYTLTHLMPELYAILLTFIIGFPLGLSSLQIVTIDLITELPPSIALTFEPGERDIMRRPPRKTTSRLVSRALLAYSYLFAGNIIAVGCMAAYLCVFWYYGIPPKDLLFTSSEYWTTNANNFTTDAGLVFTPSVQVRIHRQARAAWQITLVMAQAFHLFMCTTRRISLFRHGFRNAVAGLAILLEVLVLNFFIYTPGVQTWIGVEHPPGFVWLFCLFVAVVLLIFNEMRKYLIRHYTNQPIVRMLKW
uniref:Sodium/potassium-transporting ATPase subunit alpha-1 n=1 Tax=Ascaris suum TaxID=6253 RepID=F1KSN4_ASCSU